MDLGLLAVAARPLTRKTFGAVEVVVQTGTYSIDVNENAKV